MFPYRATLVIVSAGLLTFGVVFTLLEVTRSIAAPVPSAAVVVSTPPPASIGLSAGSLARKLSAAQSAVGVPIAGAESLLNGVEAGDRLDVLASLPAADGRPVTAVVVRGAVVLRPPSAPDALLLAVDAPDAIALAHLVLSGTHLGYVIWPPGGSPPAPRPLDERTARGLLGLAALPVPVVPLPTPTPVPPAPTPIPPTPVRPLTPVGGFIYQVQPGDTWDSVAATFTLSADELRQWNEAPPTAGLDPGTPLFVPRKS